jgi:hypothetical protein
MTGEPVNPASTAILGPGNLLIALSDETENEKESTSGAIRRE